MSCNGCRALRKGCSQSCILRPCLDWIDSPQAQSNATLFVSKFFGRSDLLSFIAAVPEKNRPHLFQSLLFEACGRTVNPVNGVLGLLSSGNWHICQMAVKTVLSGGTPRPMGAGILTPHPQTYEIESDDFHATQKWCTTSGNNNMTKQSDVEKNEMTISFNSDSEESAGSMISFDGSDQEVMMIGGEEPKLLNLFV